jgi:hypothetical protein
MTIIIGGDPGIVNFGLAVIDTNLVKVLWSGFHSAAISNLTNNLLKKKVKKLILTYPNFSVQLDNYLRVCQFHLQAWHPQQLVFERYQSRNFKGINIEKINLMIGLWAGLAYRYGIPTRVITAAAWKNTLRASGIDLLQIYADQALLGITPHMVDSVLLASFVGSEDTKSWINTLPKYLAQLRMFVP